VCVIHPTLKNSLSVLDDPGVCIGRGVTLSMLARLRKFFGEPRHIGIVWPTACLARAWWGVLSDFFGEHFILISPISTPISHHASALPGTRRMVRTEVRLAHGEMYFCREMYPAGTYWHRLVARILSAGTKGSIQREGPRQW